MQQTASTLHASREAAKSGFAAADRNVCPMSISYHEAYRTLISRSYSMRGYSMAVYVTIGLAGFASAGDGKSKLSPDIFEANKRLGRGINLGNALEAPKEGEWGVKLKAEYFKTIKDAGFATVRLPVRWSNHADK